jgi:hypothetical protein
MGFLLHWSDGDVGYGASSYGLIRRPPRVKPSPMERGSDKHNGRLDDAMSHDVRSVLQGAPVEARAADDRLQEGGEAPEAVVPKSDTLEASLEARSELARQLRPSAFPADRATLLDTARDEHASDQVLDALARLPGDTTFPTVEAVWEALGGQAETRP